MSDLNWQPGIIILGHPEIKAQLHPDRLKLLGKKVMLREGTPNVAPSWVNFCSSVRTFVAQGCVFELECALRGPE